MGTSTFQIFVNTDMVLAVENFTDSVSGALITGATVTADVFDSDDMLVTGAGSPITLVEVVGAVGLYRGTIPDTASIVVEDTGTIVITADGGAGLAGEWTLTWVAVLRTQ
jgi:hypothetical protein